jgi:hypothetical protein
VQFILQKSEKPSSQIANIKAEIKSEENLDKSSDGRKSVGLMEKSLENIGIVKGIPQRSVVEPIASPDIKIDAGKETRQSFGQFQPENSNHSSENLLDLYNQRLNNSNGSNYSNSSPSPVTSPVGVSGSLKPPAYRNPPAPKVSSMQNQKLIDLSNGNFSPIFSPNNDVLMQNVQYRDLVQLIKYQREKINTQQNDLTKVSLLYGNMKP